MPRVSAGNPKGNTLYTWLYGAVFGLVVGGLSTVVGVGVVGSPIYGAVAGLLGGVGGLLFFPWLLCMNAAETAGEGVSYHEMLDRWGTSFRLGAFGAGLTVGGILVLVAGVNDRPVPDPALGLRVGGIALAGSALVAIGVGRYARRSRDDRSHPEYDAPGEPREYPEQSSDRSVADDETESDAVHLTFDRLVRPDTLGEAFGTLLAVSVGFLYLTLIGFVSYLVLVPDASGTVGLLALAASWVGITVSLCGYSVWSAWQLRRLPRDSGQPTFRTPVKLLAHALTLLVAGRDDVSAYDERLRRTTVVFLLAIIALSAPLLAQVGGLGRF